MTLTIIIKTGQQNPVIKKKFLILTQQLLRLVNIKK